MSLKSEHLVAFQSSLPGNIVSSTVNEATGRRRFLGPETGLERPYSRHNKTCTCCGEPKRGRGSVCRPCYQKLRKTEAVLRCVWCKKEFTRPRYQYEKALRRGLTDSYCGLPCSQAHHALKNSPLCPVCGKPKQRRNAKFCSPACRRAASTPKLAPVTCGTCGKRFQPRSSRTRYCDRLCAEAEHAKRMRGAGNSHYKTGTSYAKWFTEMRPIILERDSYRCVGCGQQETFREVQWRKKPVMRSNMVIHHVDENPRNNQAENLVTLCGTCHQNHHKSRMTPFPALGKYAVEASLSMTFRLKEQATSLRLAYSPTTAPLSTTQDEATPEEIRSRVKEWYDVSTVSEGVCAAIRPR